MRVSLVLQSIAITFTWTATLSFSRQPSAGIRRHRRQHYALTDFRSFVDTTLPDTASKTLAPHTFAGMVEAALRDKFQGEDISRVLASWKLLDQDYEHKQWFHSSTPPSSSSDSEEPSRFLQYCHSYVPGLSVQPFWDTSRFSWCRKLQSQFSAIRSEFLSVTADAAGLEERGNNVWAGALTKNAAEYGESWRTLVLMDRGRWDAVNCNLFPVTAKAVKDCGVDAVEVFFARMQPKTRIEPHSDFTNFVLTSHLPLVVPYSGTNRCRLTVGDTTRQWLDGELMLFDTSLIHDAINDSDKARYILMIRLWHPDLTEVEKQALQYTYDCLEFAGLLSEEPEERFRAEIEAQALRQFPNLKTLSTVKKGFGRSVASKTPAKRQVRR